MSSSCLLSKLSAKKNNHQVWCYVEFGNCLKLWFAFRRCIITVLETENNGQ